MPWLVRRHWPAIPNCRRVRLATSRSRHAVLANEALRACRGSRDGDDTVQHDINSAARGLCQALRSRDRYGMNQASRWDSRPLQRANLLNQVMGEHWTSLPFSEADARGTPGEASRGMARTPEADS